MNLKKDKLSLKAEAEIKTAINLIIKNLKAQEVIHLITHSLYDAIISSESTIHK